jgi:hypothetical protein
VGEPTREMNDTDGQGDRIDVESHGHPRPFQVRAMERHPARSQRIHGGGFKVGQAS